MDFYELFELSQIRAISTAISPTLESIWRMRCRTYSEKFHTPLHVVQNELDPLMILEALNESKYPPSIVEEELEELLDILNRIKDPLYNRMTEQETETLVDMVLNKELARAARKKTKPTEQTIQEELIKVAAKTDEKKNTPKSGRLSFQDLERVESQAEINKSGFRD